MKNHHKHAAMPLLYKRKNKRINKVNTRISIIFFLDSRFRGNDIKGEDDMKGEDNIKEGKDLRTKNIPRK
ncbi:hypothetical protein JS55_04185 [Rickettsia felis str. LSU]|nr:hypothetical protein JS55_04185 [Rickettsia felis str. LSU]